MKKFLLPFIFIMLANFAYGQYHSVVQSSNGGVVTYRSVGYGKNVKSAMSNAELNAIKTLLFSGAEGSLFSSPLISVNESAIETEYKEFFEKFYSEDYKNFVESSVTITEFGKDAAKRKCVTLDVSVRAQQLRTYLETNGVIRKFGF